MKRIALVSLLLVFLTFVSVSTSFGIEVTKNESKNLTLNNAKTFSMPFIENVGQLTSNEIKYYANTFGGNVSITGDGRIIYSIPTVEKNMKGWVICENFIGASISKVKGEGKAITKVNYFKGKSKSKWRDKISTYDLVNFGEIYKGIELKLKAHGNNIEKLVFVHPGAEIDRLMIKVKGAKALKVDEKGQLELNTELGAIKFTAPVAYQEGKGGKQFIYAAYKVEGDSYGFTLGNYDKKKSLVIDPLLASTFIGGADSFEFYIWRTLSMDNNGNLFVTGKALSSDFPTTPGAYDETFNFSMDAFVAKLDNNLETLLASTFLGGSGDDQGNSISIDSNGNVYLTGEATTPDFPTTVGAYDTTFNSTTSDAFVAKLDNNLETLLASTFLGGSEADQGRNLVIDNSGNIYVSGIARSPDFPITPGAYDTSYGGGYYRRDIFISKLDSNLENLIASTFVGGSGPMDNLETISIASDGSIYIGGGSSSSDFPTTPGAYDTVRNSPYWNGSGFISRFDSSLSNLLASTFLEGTVDASHVQSIDLDSSGNVYVIGSTQASDFPTTPGAYDTAFTGNLNTFISKLDGNLENLLASTFLGMATTRGYAISLDDSENIYVAGISWSPDFPTTPGAFDNTHHGDYDIYISKFDNNLESLLISTFIGGSGTDSVISMLMDESGTVYIDGCTNSSDFPTTLDASDPSYNISPDYNTFVLKIDHDLSVGVGSDQDNDGISDLEDNCPNTPNSDQADTDEDGIGDACDSCPDVANPGQEDGDGDGIGSTCDNCPLDNNPSQIDSDGDDVGDLCDTCIGNENVDDDTDGMCNDSDNCRSVLNPQQEDYDGDGVGDACDNCPGVGNQSQANADGDRFGDACDNCPGISNDDQPNNDGDEQGDVCDPDDDNDGVLDGNDNCQFVANEGQADYDSDGAGDACDEDDDGDGVSDADDLCPGTALGVNVDVGGCSGEQLVDIDCPCDAEPAWKNHGQYVSCVAHAAEDQLVAGLITQAKKDAIVSARAKTGCGKKK